MKKTIRVLFVTPEAHPIIKTGGLGDVSAALPAALAARGVDVRILLPGYRQVLQGVRLRTVVRELPLLPGLDTARLLRGRMPATELPLYVLDAPALFDREGGPYQDPTGHDWTDNALRFAGLSRVAALLGTEASPLPWRPEIVHANDWQSGLAPAYLHFAAGEHARSVMSVHNMAFPGSFAPDLIPALGLPWESFNMYGVEYHGHISFLKGGLYYADHLTTVSPTYAREIQTPEFGCGFEGLLASRRADLSGILNGIDTYQWDPATDPNLFRTYGVSRLSAKAANKRGLQQRLGLEAAAEVPLIGMVSRLTLQKGSDLVLAAMPALLAQPLQLAVLGSGESALEGRLRDLAGSSDGRVSATFGFNEELAHQIEAGADIFLMPSRFEPCGLNQMYSMRYGTPPIVRRTGGLADSVVDTTAEGLSAGTATGFVFDAAHADELAACVRRALALYPDKRRWRRLQQNGMRRDFSWERSAREYQAIYRQLVGAPANVPSETPRAGNHPPPSR